MSKKLWYLKQLEVFSALSKEELKSIGQKLLEKEVPKYTLLWQPNDKNKIFIIKKGRVTLYHLTEDGRKIVVDTLGPGAIFGDTGGGVDSSIFAESSADTFVCIATKETLSSLIREKGSIAEKLFKLLFQKIARANEAVITMALPNPRDRFKRLLLQLGERYGQDEENCWVKITIPFIEEELADMVGVSRVTVSKIINEFKRKGILTREKKIIRFHNQKCAEMEEPHLL